MRGRSGARQSMMISLILTAALFLLPLALVQPLSPSHSSPEGESRLPPAEQKGPAAEPFAGGALDSDTLLRVLHEGSVVEMDLGNYLVGVVRAEMPASFEPEALKAQAVAARTYTIHKIMAGENHEEAQICTESTCCQAYADKETAFANWGAEAETYEAKVEQAVRETDGETILYGGVPVLAVFHSSSAGLTRAAGEVWQSDLPYLQPVASPESGEQIPEYYSRVEFTAAEFKEKIRAIAPAAAFSGSPSEWLADARRDDAGSVKSVAVGGAVLKGSEVRAALGLRSACFTWETKEDRLVFFVTGYGHGVGLSQHGANAMALEGADYREILTHYYTGVTVETYAPAFE